MTVLAVLGTDTGVGKTHVTVALAMGLRAVGRRVWLHKPVACGGWEGGAWPHGTAEDARRLASALGDGQPPASLCPRQYPGEMSPHLAAARVGQAPSLADFQAAIPVVPAGTLLLVESAGGLLSPIAADRATNADLVQAMGSPAILVVRAHLGTLNHTALTVVEARRRGIALLGLVVNYHGADLDSPAVATAAAELGAITGLPVLDQIAAGGDGQRLAARLADLMPD
jgi:dethiobiotin synthetase